MKTGFVVMCLILLVVQSAQASPEPETFRIRQLSYGQVREMAWSPIGRTLAIAAETGVFLLDARYEFIGALTEGSGQFGAIAWNHDGSQVAFTRWGDTPATCHVSVRRGQNLDDERRLPACGRAIWGVESAWLLIETKDARAFLWDTSQDEAAPHVFESVRDLAFSPDGRFLAYAHGEDTVTVWTLAAQSIERVLRAGGQRVAWSDDSRILLTTLTTGEKITEASSEGLPYMTTRAFNAIFLWQAGAWGMPEILEITPDTLTVTDVIRQDTDQLVATCSSADTIVTQGLCLWSPHTDTRTGGVLFGGGSSWGQFHALSPDRRYFSGWLFWQGIRLRVGLLAGGTDTILLPGVAAAWSPDSRFISAVDAAGWLYEYPVDQLGLR